MQVDRPERRLMERFAALPYDRKVVLTYAPFISPVQRMEYEADCISRNGYDHQ